MYGERGDITGSKHDENSLLKFLNKTQTINIDKDLHLKTQMWRFTTRFVFGFVFYNIHILYFLNNSQIK